jgi:hypothetical protein
MEQKPITNLMELTYWSYNRPSVSFTICLILATALICFVAAAYADKATVHMGVMKNARCLENIEDSRCRGQ